MSWRKYFTDAPDGKKIQDWIDKNTTPGAQAARSNYQSYLPEVYAGPPNRLERYNQYDVMDTDSVISASLDILSEFCTQKEEKSKEYFEYEFKDDASEAEVEVLKSSLRKWTELNDFDKRIRGIVRQCLKYGDALFVRDPETYAWIWVDPYKVEKIVVNEAHGKKPEEYWISDPDLNLMTMTFTNPSSLSRSQSYPTGFMAKQPRTSAAGGVGNVTTSAIPTSNSSIPIPAQHIVHLSLGEGLDMNWPFGNSILEQVYKSFKQKELLEDAILIYRIHRAPERRVFYVDVGNMPPHRVMTYLEHIKNEINQRRIPTKGGGSGTDNIMDATFNPMCHSLSTKIPLLDGRTLTLNELINEYNDGKENWVYSCDPITGRIVPGIISWAGETRKDAEVIKLTFDNGKTLICTPDHQIPVLNKGFVEAKDLSIDDSLISFEKQFKSINGKSGNDYEMVYDHLENNWIYTHRMVAKNYQIDQFVYNESFDLSDKNVIHHLDWNRLNNSPNNLNLMNWDDHKLFHIENNYWNSASKEAITRSKDKIRNSLNKYRSTLSSDDIGILKNKRSIGYKKAWKNLKEDTFRFNNWKKNVGNARSEYLKNNPKDKDKWIKGSKAFEKNHNLNQKFIFSHEMLQRLVDLVKTNKSNKVETIKLLNNDKTFMDLMKEKNIKNPAAAGSLNPNLFTGSKFNIMYREFGYDNWKDFKKKLEFFNHRIITIEYLKDKLDTGCITVNNDYHTFAIDSGIFVKNSMTEDFFFPQHADGRGSRVDTLPGGENLGQINDLDYFDNKLKQGLQIPSSYISGASTDDTAGYNDGRATTALIAELRFQKYCERIQSLINDNFDREFKLYLKAEGVQIDASLFQLVLNVPQNFAKYRQIELDNSRIATWSQIADTPYISNRFALKRWLGLTEDEIVENEMMWKEENKSKTEAGGDDQNIEGLGAMGIRPEPDLGMDEFGDDELGLDDEFGLDDGGSPIAGGELDGGNIPPPPPPGGGL